MLKKIGIFSVLVFIIIFILLVNNNSGASAALRVSPRTPQTQSLVTGITYVRSFTLPYDDGRDTSPSSRLSWSRFGPAAVSEDGLYLYWVCHDQNDNATNPPALAKVRISDLVVTRPCTPMPNYAAISPNDLGSGIKLGGALEYQGKLIVTAVPFYDAGHVQEKSHWTCDTNIQNCQGPFRLSSAPGTTESATDRIGMQTRYMGLIPPEWRTLLGGYPALTGMAGGQISIIHRQSYGPTATAFDPLKVGTGQNVKLLVGYPDEHQELYDPAQTIPRWKQITQWRATGGLRTGGFAFPTGSRSIVFIGSSGEKFEYGVGTHNQALDGTDSTIWIAEENKFYPLVYDPLQGAGYLGCHAYPLKSHLWHYDANDLLAVQNGSKEPWELRPTLLPVSGPLGNSNVKIDGAAYDQANNLWYLYDESPNLTVYVYKVDFAGSGTTPTVDIKANGADSLTIASGTSATISWTSANATACTVTPGGWTGTSGSQSTGALTVTQKYDISCDNGAATDSVTVTVTTATPSVNIKANNSDGPITITSGQSATLSWTSANVTACTVSPGGWTGTSNTSQSTGALTVNTTYNISCTGGTASDAVTVNVTPTTSNNVITVTPSTTLQTMRGWEVVAQADHLNSNFSNYQNASFDKVVEAGMNRIRLEVRSGSENSRDSFGEWMAAGHPYTKAGGGSCTPADIADPYCKWRYTRYETINDNSSATSMNSSNFHFTELDDSIDKIVNPLRTKLSAKGEQLYVNLTYVGFYGGVISGQPNVHQTPAEYAEFMLAVFQHLQAKYGWVPNAINVVLEPDNTTGWNGTTLGDVIAATGARLSANGFTPDFISPSVTNISNLTNWFDNLWTASGGSTYLDEISYHRYFGASGLSSIASKAQTRSVSTSMLEWWDDANNFNVLHEDLTVGRNSAWEQSVIVDTVNDSWSSPRAFSTSYVNPNVSGGVATFTNPTKFLQQYYKYVRMGAVRVGATSNNAAQFDPLAFRNTDGKFTVVVKANPTSADKSFSINGLPAGTYGIYYTGSTTGDVQNPDRYNITLSDQTISSGGVVTIASMPYYGVITIYGKTAGTTPTADVKANGSDSTITITSGNSVTISWSSTNASSCTASGAWSGSKATSGSQSLSPTVNSTYTITCNGASDSVTVNVNTPTATADIKADGSDGPITITSGTATTISWTSSNASSCTASGAWSGSKATSGS
ncbi:hypothetical protein HZA26_02305, partial [Candidatus Nomurabacteria bacterium]|nr:hypothetical protein [Candidatus Nomurabacteria bacterium]